MAVVKKKTPRVTQDSLRYRECDLVWRYATETDTKSDLANGNPTLALTDSENHGKLTSREDKPTMRQTKTVSLTKITRFLKANGLDPKSLKGSDKLYGPAKTIRISVNARARICEMLALGKPVLLRPTQQGKKGFEIMDPARVVFSAGTHGARPARAVVTLKATDQNPFANKRAKELGKTLADLRKAAGISHQGLMAERLGIGYPQYNRYERGTVFPRPETLAKIAQYVKDNPALKPFEDRLLDVARAS